MMAKKNLARRSLAMIMAMIMCLSLFQITVFASDENTITYPEVTIASNGATTSVEGSNGTSVSGSKMLRQTGDNTFEVTLNVQTVSTSETIFTADAAHVVLVIDKSGSMGENGRMRATKDAAKAFANTVLGKDGANQNKVAVVTYDQEAVTKNGLTHSAKNVCDQIDSIPNNPSYDCDTNIHAGLHAARNILQNDPFTGKKIIVLMSDGEATNSYQMTGTATCDWNDTLSNINITGCDYNKMLGNGDDYRIYNGYNLKLDVTDPDGQHYYPIQVDYGVDGLIPYYDTSNNGYGAIWEAVQAKSAGVEVYSIMLGSNTNARRDMQRIASDGNHYQTTTDVGEIAKLFTNVSTEVITPASGNILTDPMSQYVTLGDVAQGNEGEITTVGSQIQWDLSKATPVSTTEDGTTTNTYTLTYQITVNRSKAFYDAILDSDAVPTNGTTTLDCILGGESKPLNFTVPTVTSDMPDVPYTVNYYKQNTDGNYSLSKITLSKSYGETFHGETQDYGDGYFFDTGLSNVASPTEPKAVSLSTAENVINIYYSLPDYTVTVTHMLQTKTLDDHGNATYAETPLGQDAPVTVYYGGSFNAADKIKTPGEHDSWEYDSGLTQEKEPDQDLSLSDITGNKTLTIWYSALVDSRMDISYTATHHVTTHSWAYNDSTKKWEESDSTQDYKDKDTPSTGKYGMNSEVIEPLKEYASHLDHVEIDGVRQNDNNTVVALTNPEGHQIDLYYDVPATNEPDKASYQYVHHYKLITSTDSGKTENTEPQNGALVNGHVGDLITTTESDAVRSHKGVDYDLTTTVPFDTTLTAGEKATDIDLYYTKDTTVGVDVNVNYYYEVYNEKVDPTSGDPYFDYTTPDATRESKEETIHMLAGNLFTLTPNDEYVHYYADNYTVDTTRTNTAVNVPLESGETHTYKVYCVQENYVDQDQEGSVTVNFNYYTLKTYYDENGDLQENERTLDGTDPQTFHGVLGDTFEKDLITSYKEHSDYELADGDTTSDPVTATIVKKDGSEVNVNFYRSEDLRTETTVTVTPVFVTRTAHATADGKGFTYSDGDPLEGTSVTYPLSENETLYAGQRWSAVPESSPDGFTFDSARTTEANDYENVLLGDSENPTNIKLYYVKDDETALEPVTVIVRHYRTINTFNVDTETLDPGTPVKDTVDDEYSGYYVGNSFSTEGTSRAGDFEVGSRPADSYSITADNVQTVQLDGQDTRVLYVDWYYTQDSYPQTVNVIVNYKVTVKEYATKEVVGDPVEISGEATPYKKRVGTLFNTPNYMSYTDDQIDHTVLNDEETDSKSFRVSASGDTVTLEYVIYQDTRQDATVLVQHNYFDLDTYTGVETPVNEKTHTVEVKTLRDESDLITNDIYVGATYTAAIDGDTGDYTCRTANEALTTVLDAPETRMTVEYVKTISSDPGSATYIVRHDYYVNGQFEGSVNGVGGAGKVGSTVSGADVAPVLLHNGQVYTQTGATGLITLSNDGENLIVLTYNRTEQPAYSGGGDDRDDGDDDIVIPSNPTPLSPTPEITTDIPEDNVPQTDVPETDIPDEETPLAATPAKTGDNLILWVMAAGVSGIGLVWVSLMGRKRRDEDGSQN